MKPKLLKIALAPEHSFSARYEAVPYFFSEWHFHPEIELVYINDGTGTQFIGDNIQQFNTGDMVLVGSNLPHLWQCDEIYFINNTKLKAASTVIHFMPDMLGEAFFKLPEHRAIDKLLEKARMGLQIHRQTKTLVLEKNADPAAGKVIRKNHITIADIAYPGPFQRTESHCFKELPAPDSAKGKRKD